MDAGGRGLVDRCGLVLLGTAGGRLSPGEQAPGRHGPGQRGQYAQVRGPLVGGRTVWAARAGSLAQRRQGRNARHNA